jgi:hypothetical protein
MSAVDPLAPPPPLADLPPPSPGVRLSPDLQGLLAAQQRDEEAFKNDPQHKANLEAQRTGLERMRRAAESADTAASEFDAAGPPKAQERFTEAQPDLRDFAVKGMPFLLMATALGGKVAKTSGLGMLSAMNGMMEGAAQGSEEAYNAAHKKWQDHYKQFQDEQKAAMELHKQTLSWYKDKTQGQRAAAEMWGEYVGAAKNSDASLANQFNAFQKAKLQVEVLDKQLQRNAQARSAKIEDQKFKLMKETGKLSSGVSKMTLAETKANKLKELLPRMVEKYKAATGATVAPDNIGKLFTALSGDPDVGTFVQLSKSLKADLVGIELPPGIRGNMFIEKIDADTAPNLWTMSATQLESAVNDVQSRFATEKSRQQAVFDAFQNELSALGGPDMRSTPTPMTMPGASAGKEDPLGIR